MREIGLSNGEIGPQERDILRVYFTADTHFGHSNVLKYCKRIWLSKDERAWLERDEELIKKDVPRHQMPSWRVSRESTENMNDALIENINKTVGEDDILYHLGDFCFAPRFDYQSAAKRYRNRIKCRNVHVVWGNHDDFSIKHLFSSNHLMTTVSPNNQSIVLCHYAMAVWNKSHHGAWMLYGHSHSNAEPWLDKMMPNRRSIDVGVDNAYKILGDYRPFSFEELQKIMSVRQGCSIDHHGAE